MNLDDVQAIIGEHHYYEWRKPKGLRHSFTNGKILFRNIVTEHLLFLCI